MKKQLIAAVLLSAIALTGCTVNFGSSDNTMGMHGSMQSSDESSSTYDASAIMFAQMMIPHHRQALVMADLALTQSSNTQVLDLAQRIKQAQAPEIAQMQTWLKSSGAEELSADGMMNHGMEMSGMLTDTEISRMAAASGKAFDVLFLEGMIGHHEGAISMVNMIDENSNPEVKSLGEAIVSAQKAEISEMQSLLADLK